MRAMNSPSPHQHAPQRDTIYVCDAPVISQLEYPGKQFILRVHAPDCAARAEPGSFAHISCEASLPMRRPLSIMRVSKSAGWVEFLYKIVGDGTRLLAERVPGETINLMGPIGKAFKPLPERPRAVLIGGGVGIPPMVFLADSVRQDASVAWQPVAFLGSELPFPFDATDSSLPLGGLPNGVTTTYPLLESWGVPARLASGAGFDGCYRGYVTELASRWLSSCNPQALSETALYACGPTEMLRAVAAVAAKFSLPCQVSLEEFMACAVGGCAGCTVLVQTETGPAMRRVCVDGPVFEAASVFPG